MSCSGLSPITVMWKWTAPAMTVASKNAPAWSVGAEEREARGSSARRQAARALRNHIHGEQAQRVCVCVQVWCREACTLSLRAELTFPQG